MFQVLKSSNVYYILNISLGTGSLCKTAATAGAHLLNYLMF